MCQPQKSRGAALLPAAQDTPVPRKLQRVPSVSSVLQNAESDCESPQPASSPAPTLLESTLSAVAAAVLLRAPLPAQVVALLRALFPSAAELLASAPAADGLGLEVCSLLPAPAAPREQLAAPLPAGGALCFGLRKGPAPGELALMEAFAAALAARLGQLDASLQAPASPPPPATPPAASPAVLPADCFWESV